jgi:hypothetical protein
MKISKVEFLTRLEAAKSKLPTGVIPLYMTRHPKANRVRVSNTINGKTHNLKILENVEDLSELITSK